MSGPNKGLAKTTVSLKWDASPIGEPDHDLDIIAATYLADAPHGDPAYLVYFDSRSPDGTITLSRDSHTGQGLGFDEVMVFEFQRLDPRYARVVVGVAIQQRDGHKTFGQIPRTLVRIAEGYDELGQDDFASVSWATAATVAEFTRDETGAWTFRKSVRGFDDADPRTFAALMGRPAA
ncbi:TerD family protein [Streptomyces sp. URMC 129]|uniref:TerD family protein n=1 Tax=Streptomyces sp. URMC 129 TaxID=3423407 RepID=UPI003F196D7D